MNFPLHFAWKQKVRQWSLRQNQHPGLKKESIGRLPFLTPAHGDIFYLQTLLCHEHCKGKKSYLAMRTYRGKVFKSYKDVCYEIGLLSDDREWRKCLEEADIASTPRRLREVFATIIVFNRPADVYNPLFEFLIGWKKIF